MDEFKAIEKSVSELKRIQNRLGKVLKDREWAITFEIPRLQTIIDEKKKEIDSLLKKLSKSVDEYNKLKLNIDSKDLLIEQQKRDLRDEQKDNEKLKERLRGYESSYEYRILKASNQFLEEKISSMETKLIIATKTLNGNHKGLEALKTAYTKHIDFEKLLLERRIKELEQMQAQLMKDYQKVIKENEELKLKS